MKSITSNPGALSRTFRVLIKTILLPVLVFALRNQTMQAGSATWSANPASGDWNTATNWTPNTVPNGASDVATFATSTITAVSLSSATEVSGIVFDASASGYQVLTKPQYPLTISGPGITNNSVITQSFVAAAGPLVAGEFAIFFENSASAGSNTLFTARGAAASSQSGGGVYFSGSSTAGDSTFTANGADVVNGGSSSNGRIAFSGSSTAGNGVFTSNGGTVTGAPGGTTEFVDTSTGGNATLTSNGGVSDARPGYIEFGSASTAGNATLIANRGHGAKGGIIAFSTDSTGGTARVATFGGGNLDLSFHNAPGVSVGSIEGNGVILLGSNQLTVGNNNLSTNFSGVLRNGGMNGGLGGSFAKAGTGRLILAGASRHTGGTTVSGGELLVENTSDSGTGTGAVSVEEGALGGRGIIAGAVTVGTGSGPGAILSPGLGGNSIGTLTIQSTLQFNSDATYRCALNSNVATADEVIANGITIDGGGLFSITDRGATTLAPGTVFTIIDNTAAIATVGTFSNLPDGSTITVGNNTFQASYEGGDGNDLTLTVVP